MQHQATKQVNPFQRQDDEGSSDYPEQDETEKALGLPNNAKSIRENLVDEFKCEGRPYGYYADVANDCQVRSRWCQSYQQFTNLY